MWSPSRTPSFISASKQRRNRTNLRKTTHQIQFPKQNILKFWTMQSKSCLFPFVTSVQRIQSFGSIFLLQITLERTNDTITSLGRVSFTGLLATSITNFDNQYFSDRASISAAISSLKAVWPCVNRSPWRDHHNLIPELEPLLTSAIQQKCSQPTC